MELVRHSGEHNPAGDHDAAVDQRDHAPGRKVDLGGVQTDQGEEAGRTGHAGEQGQARPDRGSMDQPRGLGVLGRRLPGLGNEQDHCHRQQGQQRSADPCGGKAAPVQQQLPESGSSAMPRYNATEAKLNASPVRPGGARSASAAKPATKNSDSAMPRMSLTTTSIQSRSRADARRSVPRTRSHPPASAGGDRAGPPSAPPRVGRPPSSR